MGAEIQLQDVSLKFRVYRNPSPALKEHVVSILQPKNQDDKFFEFYSLKDISLRIKHGERVGIIGLNGAGKSTLLKSIVGIYPPTTGAIRIRGKVVPLIEVGTGFDLEMSGRANIHLNGALLARGREEMMQLEEQIIEFSELHDFIDMPLKYYSSGMAGRLAFSIATMVEPEILVVDEIFATGDAQFVGKAMGRMKDLIDKSHIVIMVSHSMDHIRNICNRVLVMDHGRIVKDGPTDEMIEYYYSEIVGQTELHKPLNSEAESVANSVNPLLLSKAEFDRNGSVAVPFLNLENITELRNLWGQTAPNYTGNYFVTALDSNPDRRKYVHDSITAIIKQRLKTLLPSYRICLAFFDYQAPDRPNCRIPLQINGSVSQQSLNRAITAWIPLTDVDETNGCMRVVAGSHRFSEHISTIPPTSSPFEKLSQYLDEEFAQALPLEAGQLLLFDQALLHGFTANGSNTGRIAVCALLLPNNAVVRVYKQDLELPSVLKIFELTDEAFLVTDVMCEFREPFSTGMKFIDAIDYKAVSLNTEQIDQLKTVQF